MMFAVGLLICLARTTTGASCCASRDALATVGASALLASAVAPPADAAPADGTGEVSGTVSAQGQPLPADVVVYLEAKDPARRFASPVKQARISQKGAQFSPALTVIAVGQTVEFVNDEDRAVEHNVFSNSPGSTFDLGLFPQGQSRSVTFDKPGSIVLYCSVHRFMDSAVFVSPTPFHSRVGTDGRYRIIGVPSGEFAVKVWQRRKRFPDVSVDATVADRQVVTVNLELRRK